MRSCQVWGMRGVLRLVFAFQSGYPQSMLPFVHFKRDATSIFCLTNQFPLFVDRMVTLERILVPFLDQDEELKSARVDSLVAWLPDLKQNVLCYAVWAARFDLLQLIHPYFEEFCYASSIMAACCGKLDVLAYLEEQGWADISSQTLHFACQHGHLDIVEYLHPRVPKARYNTMAETAAKGHLHVLKFLHANRSEECNMQAMNGAATYGHLEIVKFLHYNRSEGCSFLAMDAAAANGHLEVVKFLHENRNEGATEEAINMAAESGHLDVIKYLFENRSEGCTYRALRNARRNQHREVEAFLLEHAHELGINLKYATAL
ncbi:hypothetical protein LEN26_016973 [Aphanomyces euteiches]|nr:hypothetical protein LEN26_016973 [Aphanomyces euteiches]